MGRKVTAGRGWSEKSGEGSSRGGSKGKRKRGMVVGENSQSESDSESSEELPSALRDAQRRKEKAKKDMAKWKKSIKMRGVTCERQVLREQIVDVIVVRILLDRGLDFFFNKVDGYNRGMCVEFYKNMKIDISGTIKSKVRGKTIMITADTIASYLHYVRPSQDQIQYPRGNYSPLDAEAYGNAIYMTPGNYKGGKFVLGKMKPEYKLMAKIIHYNIAPTRSEKELKLADAEFLYIMMNSFVVDVAECIWNEMVAFKEKSPPRSNMPFVAMISQLCKMAGVLVVVSDDLLLPPIGPITMASVKKSTAMSRTPVIPPTKQVDIPSTSTAPSPRKRKSWKGRIESHIKKLLCHQLDINHKLDYCVRTVEQYSGIPYKPLEGTKKSKEEEENDEEEEEEDDDSE